MPTGSDGDDDAPIEIELEPTDQTIDPEIVPEIVDDDVDIDDEPAASPPPLPPAMPATVPPAAAVAAPAPAEEPRPPAPDPLIEAAAGDWRRDLALFESEAAAHPDAGRRAALLVEVARLHEEQGQDQAAALAAARAAVAAHPSLQAPHMPVT
jgi:hypothetical protein